MVLTVDLKCSKCFKKVKKVLCKFPEIQDQVYDKKKDTVTIKVVSNSPEKIKEKIICKGGNCIKSIEIKVPKKSDTEKPTGEQKGKPPPPKTGSSTPTPALGFPLPTSYWQRCYDGCPSGPCLRGRGGPCSCRKCGPCSGGGGGSCSCGKCGPPPCSKPGPCSWGHGGPCSCGQCGPPPLGKPKPCSWGRDGPCSCGKCGPPPCGRPGPCSCSECWPPCSRPVPCFCGRCGPCTRGRGGPCSCCRCWPPPCGIPVCGGCGGGGGRNCCEENCSGCTSM